jgi:diaminopimelate decarboxylase
VHALRADRHDRGAVGEGVLSTVRRVRLVPDREGYHRRDGTLCCERVPLDAIATSAGTPTFVYSAGAIRAQYTMLDGALAGVPHRLHYSVKASSSLGILSLLRSVGAGVDIVSGGELHRALAVGFRGGDVVFSGVGKTDRELDAALAAEVRLINVESVGELRRLSALAVARGAVAPVALRVNPEVTVDTPHPYTRTGMRGMKFGIPYDGAVDAGMLALSLPGLRLAGLDMHIGSQIQEVEPYRHGADRLGALAETLREAGAADLRYLDVGGGLAVSYDDEAEASVEAFARAMIAVVRRTSLELLVEPGRFLVGNAGVLLSRVIDRKHSGGKDYVIVDAGMNDLLRPSHYNAFHRIDVVTPRSDRREMVDVVGPVCESGDFLALDRELEVVEPGDLIAVRSAGAYGYSMSSNYNSRPRAAEVLVDGDRFAVITARESYPDLVRQETHEPEWRQV